jgi:hypothetical protein
MTANIDYNKYQNVNKNKIVKSSLLFVYLWGERKRGETIVD